MHCNTGPCPQESSKIWHGGGLGSFQELEKGNKQTLRKAEQDYFNQKIVANKNNSTAIWKTIRHTLPNKSDQGTPYSKDTSVLANSADSLLVYQLDLPKGLEEG